jgi:beta-glucosidase
LPIHPAIASKLHLLEGIPSFEAAMADPVLRARLDEFMSITGAPEPPQVETRAEEAPGPHGTVPVPAPPELQTLAHVMEYRPQALGAAVTRAAEVLPDTPFLITENGIATTDDEQRLRFTGDALGSLAEVIAADPDVRGYVHWSLLDNFEWMSGYTPTFGLVAVDRTTFTRTPKSSLTWLGTVARGNGLPG